MTDCIFCKIIAGEIPSNKIMETDHAFAFMDIGPLSAGHCLFIPKTHAEKLHDVPDKDLQDILVMIKQVAKAGNFENYNILQNNGEIAHQVVMHAHWHLIPKHHAEDGLKIKWTPDETIDQNEIADTIRANLKFAFD
ncbi:MAG: HIT family protein [Candidatus Heimdallarchaeota archaeon]|nr:HIT family protein [Candidatus Heimdallarchaeota archaeon]